MNALGIWMDEYKKGVQWDELFGNIFPTNNKTKYHDLPIAMQLGIFIQFTSEMGNGVFIDGMKNFDYYISAIQEWFYLEKSNSKQGGSDGMKVAEVMYMPVSVKERLPEKQAAYIVLTNSGGIYVTDFSSKYKNEWDRLPVLQRDYITYWLDKKVYCESLL
jgi:hypothetical protein